MHLLPPLPPRRQVSQTRLREVPIFTDASGAEGLRRGYAAPRERTSGAMSRTNTPPGLRLEPLSLELSRSTSVPAFTAAESVLRPRRLSRDECLLSREHSPEDRTSAGPRGRSSSRGSSPQLGHVCRPASEGSSRYEAECKRTLILPKFLRNAQAALQGEELDFGELSLGDAQLAALVTDNVLVPSDKIRRWKLSGNRLTHVGAASLGSALQCGVRVLNLARNELGTKGADAMRSLTAGHQLTLLRSLNLSSNGLRNDGLSALCDALTHCQLLLRLDLNCNEIREGASLGGLLAEHANITRLALHGNFLLAAGGASLFAGVLSNLENGGRLADIDVAWNGLGEGGAVDCAKALASVVVRPGGLFHLDLSYNGFGSQCCAVIATAMRDNHQLYGLHLVGNAVVVDSNGFLSALKSSGDEKLASAIDPNQGLVFGDPRAARSQSLAAARKSTVGQQHSNKLWSDDDILRDRDPLEQQTSCWACEGWERIELRWSAQARDHLPLAVWAFTSLDNFRSAVRLKPEPDDCAQFVGTRMVPPGQRLLVIFQVDTDLQLQPDAEVEKLKSSTSIQLCFCKELPQVEPSVLQVTEASVATIHRVSQPTAYCGLAGQRVVLISGPDGPVQVQRVTETEFDANRGPSAPKPPILTSFRGDTSIILQKCFESDWSLVKRDRLIPTLEEADVGKLIESHYGKIVALYRRLSASSVTGASGFGVSSLEAGSFATESGLLDGQVTKISDVDRLFIAASVMSTEQRRGMRVRNDKVLVRFQFLEFLIRIADQRFRQTREVSSMLKAVSRVFDQLQPLADARLKGMADFFSVFHCDEVDEVYREHLPRLESAYSQFGGRAGPTGHSIFMSLGQFQILLDRIGAYDNEFQQRLSGVAFRMGMMTQADECYDSRFQEMSFLEFLHALGAVVYLRAGYAPAKFAELLTSFFSKQFPDNSSPKSH